MTTGSVPLKDSDASVFRPATFTRMDGANLVQMQAVVPVDPNTGEANAATEATLSSLVTALNALSAKVSACNTNAVALDPATLAALETINAVISGTVAISNFPETQGISANALPLPAGAATELTLAAANAKLPALEDGRIPVVLPAGGGGLTNSELREAPLHVADDTVGGLLRRMLALLMSPRGYDKSMARQRVTANIENLPTLGAVTTVGTVGNLGQIAGRDAVMLINPTNRTSWALNHRSRIS